MNNIKIKKSSVLLTVIFSLFITMNPCFAYAQGIKEYVLHQGQSMFISRNHIQDGNILKSENENIVTVSDGILTAKSVGETFCTAVDNEQPMQYKIKVLAPQEVKYLFTEPNIPQKGVPISLVAITDKSIKNIMFSVETSNGIIKVKAKDHIVDGENVIHKGYVTINEIGDFKVKVQTFKRFKWRDTDKNTFTIKVNDINEQQVLERRPSDDCLSYIKTKEGFKAELSRDKIVNGVYDIGYGNVIYAEVPFYNNITETEATAMFIDKVNQGVYCTSLNNFLIGNNIAVTQNQFDALLSFTYNLGPSWTKSSDLKKILLNIKDTASLGNAYVNSDIGLRLRSNSNTNSSIIRVLNYNEKVTILDVVGNWYKVRTDRNEEGYCFGEYLTLDNNNKASNHINANNIKTAHVNSDIGLRLRAESNTRSKIIKLMSYNEKVTVLDSTINGWYKVKTQDNKEGYCFGEYLTLESSPKESLNNIENNKKSNVIDSKNNIKDPVSSDEKNTQRTLNDIDKKEFSDEWLLYHRAGGKCIRGLVNRRVEELQIFFHKDYSIDGYKNKYGFDLPKCH